MDVHELLGRSGYHGNRKRSKRAATLMALISVRAPSLFCYFSFFCFWGPSLSPLLLFFPLLPSFPIQLTYEWRGEEGGRQGTASNWLQSWVGRSKGTNQGNMYNRLSQLSWVIFTVRSRTINAGCVLRGSASSQRWREKAEGHQREWWRL